MVAYSFRQNCKLYIVKGSQRWLIDIYPDLDFSQTFSEKAINVKTLHDQNAMFENAVINSANPANFSFTVLLPTGINFAVIHRWLTERNGTGSDEALYSYDIYVDTGVDIFKLTKGIATRATFQIARDRLVTVSIEGTASKLSRFGASGTTIPGTLQAKDASVTAVIPRALNIELDGVPIENIAGLSLELSNDVQWLEYDTLHSSLYVTSAADSQYPTAFFVSKKVLSGAIQQYVTDTNQTRVNTWSTGSTLRIRIHNGTAYYLDVNIPSVVFTNRLQVGDLFTQSYDFRMNHNPASLDTIIKYT